MPDPTTTISDHFSVARAQTSPARGALPLAGLLALAAAGFLTMLTETVPAGLLSSIGSGLGVSSSRAGQLLTVYSLGSMLAAIPLTALARRLPRRPLLLATILAVAVVNLITMLSGAYDLTLVARLLAGAGAGVQWAMIAGYAMRLVDEANQGRALAVSMAGIPLALAFGVPGGTLLGSLIGWRSSFTGMAALAVLISAWTVCKLPNISGETARDRISLRAVLTRPGLIVILIAAFAFELGHMNYTYVSPFLTRAGLGRHVSAVLLVFGVAAVIGLWAAGALIDRHLPAVVLTAFALFTAAMLTFAAAGRVAVVVLVAVAVWGFALGGAPTMLQAAAARAAGPGSDVAQSMLVTVLNAGMSAGAASGGAALAGAGIGTLALTSFAIFAATLVLALLARRHAFPPPQRSDAEPCSDRSLTRKAKPDPTDRQPLASHSQP